MGLLAHLVNRCVCNIGLIVDASSNQQFVGVKLKPGYKAAADLITFTEEILNGGLRFLCGVNEVVERNGNGPLLSPAVLGVGVAVGGDPGRGASVSGGVAWVLCAAWG